MINNQDPPHNQNENDKFSGAEYPNQNSKQREVFNVVHTWAKDYIKYNGHNIEPIHIFLSSSRGKGKSHLMKVIYHAILKTLLYYCQDAE